MAKIDPISGFPEFLPAQQLAFDDITGKIKAIYEGFGYVPLETAAVERIDTLVSKGIDSKEVYALRRLNAADGDDGSKELALRFDLTVPLARYVSQHYANLVFPFRRYQCQPVWRGERPQYGRYRQFHQFDLDVIGDGSLDIAADAEVIAGAHQAIKAILPEGAKFTMRVNNRKYLTEWMRLIVADDKIPAAIKAIDDLEKVGREKTKDILFELKGDRHGEHMVDATVSRKPETFETFLAGARMGDHLDYDQYIELNKAVGELEEVYKVLCALLGKDVVDASILVDPTIARGLDYYTGTVVETRLEAAPELGSICSGGRYENLAESLSERSLPGVGVSIGISRLSAWLMQQAPYKDMAASKAKVIVTGPYAPALCQKLRAEGVACELALGDKSAGQHFQNAQKRGLAYGIVAEAYENITLRVFSDRSQVQMTLETVIPHLKAL